MAFTIIITNIQYMATRTQFQHSSHNNKRQLHDARKRERALLRQRKNFVVNGLSGLSNMGNTCYMNATLQCLAKVECLLSYLIDDSLFEKEFDMFNRQNIQNKLANKLRKDKKLSEDTTVSLYTNDINKAHDITISYSLHKLFKELWIENRVIAPRSIKDAIAKVPRSIFAGYSQQDSQEVLSLILDTIHEECKTDAHIDYTKIPDNVKTLEKYCQDANDYINTLPDGDYKKQYINQVKTYLNSQLELTILLKSTKHWQSHLKANGYSFLTELFGGQILSTVTCDKCKIISPSFDIFMGVISVPIPSHGEATLESCLEKFAVEEHLYGDNKYNCEVCNDKTTATKKLWLYQCPPVLIIQLKRFSNDIRGAVSRNGSTVKFPIKNLQLSKNIYYLHDQDPTLTYDLCAITQHTGSIHGGHYIAYAINPINKLWYRYNDSNIHHIPESDLEKNLVTDNSYVLYYQKRVQSGVENDPSDKFSDAPASEDVVESSTENAVDTFIEEEEVKSIDDIINSC